MAEESLPCQKDLRSNFDPVETAIEIEDQITKLNDLIFEQNLSRHLLAKDLERAQSFFSISIDEMGQVSAAKTEQDLESLKHSLNKISDQLYVVYMRRVNTDFNMVIADPRLARPDFLYSVNSMDPYLKRVSFSEDVLANVFWADDSNMKRATELILKALIFGRSHATNKSGVVSFAAARDVYKVKITGNTVGAVRVAGFFRGTDFLILDWANESSHGVHSSRRLVDRVRSKRERNLSSQN